MSPVVNKSTAPATTQAQPSNPTPPLASATAAATTGAAAGDTSRRAAEQQRLRRILDTVARQEPGLSWAAGLRDNGQTPLLVTDLASAGSPHTFAYPPTSPCSNRPPDAATPPSPTYWAPPP
ncbi:putative transmembrane protein [Mycobacterium tuberculosis]|nr:putative transmembrane protein [Mycobacterium tuberculosis]